MLRAYGFTQSHFSLQVGIGNLARRTARFQVDNTMRNINKLFATALMTMMVIASDNDFTRDRSRAMTLPVAEIPENYSNHNLIERKTADSKYTGTSDTPAAIGSGGSSKGRRAYGELTRLLGIKSPDQGRKKSPEQIKYVIGKRQAKHKEAENNAVT